MPKMYFTAMCRHLNKLKEVLKPPLITNVISVGQESRTPSKGGGTQVGWGRDAPPLDTMTL